MLGRVCRRAESADSDRFLQSRSAKSDSADFTSFRPGSADLVQLKSESADTSNSPVGSRVRLHNGFISHFGRFGDPSSIFSPLKREVACDANGTCHHRHLEMPRICLVCRRGASSADSASESADGVSESADRYILRPRLQIHEFSLQTH